MKTFLNLLTGLALIAVSTSAAGAQVAVLVEDIATETAEGPEDGPVLPPFQPLGERLFFLVNEATSGREPWITDGSLSGTRMLADTCPDPCISSLQPMGKAGDRLFWLDGRRRLWSTDGTAEGTVFLPTPPRFSISMRNLNEPDAAVLGRYLYFGGCLEGAPSLECGLWRTDGTPAGTGPVPLPGAENASARQLTSGAGRVSFLTGEELWSVDAKGQLRKAAEIEIGYGPNELWATRENLLFLAESRIDSRELWVSDGTPGGTRSVLSLPFEGALTAWLTVGSRAFYFVADDDVHGAQVWRSDGTSQGTRRITGLSHPESPFYIRNDLHRNWAEEIDGNLLFAAGTVNDGLRLWMTTGTPESTRAVSESLIMSPLVRAGDQVFFFGGKGEAEPCEVWSFNGRGVGTRLAEGLGEEACQLFSLDNFLLRGIGDRVWFAGRAADGTSGVWRSDGSRAGTVRILSLPTRIDRIEVTAGGRVYVSTQGTLWTWTEAEGLRQVVGAGPRTRSSSPADLTSQAGKLLFSACADASREMWSSQGSAGQTSPLTSLNSQGCDTPLEITTSGSSIFFLRSTSNGTRELWRTDAAGSAPVQLTPPIQGMRLVAFQGGVWFLGPEGRLWKSDGTPVGTGPAPSPPGGGPLSVFPAPYPFAVSEGNRLYLLASRENENPGIWSTDGTSGGTVRLAGLSSLGTSDLNVLRAGSTLFLALGDSIWTTDGTPEGTVRLRHENGDNLLTSVRHPIVHNGALYAYGSDNPFVQQGFWRIDGTPQGLRLIARTRIGDSYGNEVPRPVSHGGRLFFVGIDEDYGTELRVTDGTPAGTTLVADIHPGPGGSFPLGLTAVGGDLWFSAHDTAHGRELWRTDGTAAGTRLVQDIAPEGLSSFPRDLTVAGNRLYFSADDGVTGRELWSLPLTGPGGCQPNETTLCLRDGRFRVEAHWRDFEEHQGVGRAVPLTGDTGTFWFFEPSNVEVLLKVLDGRGLNDHFWVFFGALSSVEYSLTVTDTQTGFSRRYTNPSGQLASSGDTEGFGPRGAHSVNPDLFTAPPSPPALISARTEPAAATGSCQPGPRRLCLNGGRFAVEASWKDFQGNTGQGTAVPLTPDTGWFWFFDPANVEVMLKVLDGTPLNGRFWVFYGALSNVEYSLTVTDTHTGAVKVYRNPSGRFASVADTDAF